MARMSVPGVAMGGARKVRPSSGSNKLRGFDVRIADNGGAIVTHNLPYNDGPYRPNPEHVFSNPREVHDHIRGIYPDVQPTRRQNIQEPGEQAGRRR